MNYIYVTRLRLDLSHLREHKFKHSFQNTLNPFCDYGCEIKITTNFLLHCPQFSTERSTLLNKIKSINTSMLSQSDSNLTKTFLFGDPRNNTLVINASIDFVLDTKRFNGAFVLTFLSILIY